MGNVVRKRVAAGGLIWSGFLLAAAGPAAPPAPAPPPAASAPAPPGEPAITSAWLGVFVGDAIDGGVQLVEVVPGGPAQKAGLRPGDLLIRLGGKPVPDREAVEAFLASLRPGTRLAAEILREGRAQTRWLVAAPRTGPAWSQIVRRAGVPEAARELDAQLDATIVAIPEGLRVHYGAPADRGALVAGVGSGGVGAASGLLVGDVIVAIDGEPVRDPGEFQAAAQGSSRRIELVRGGQMRALELRGSPATPAPRDEVPLLRAEIERLRARVNELERQLDRLRGGRTQ